MQLADEQGEALQRVRQVESKGQLWRAAQGCMQRPGD